MKKTFFLFLLACTTASASPISIQIDDGSLIDVARVIYSEVSKEPFILSQEALNHRRQVSISLKNQEPTVILKHFEQILKSEGYTVTRKSGVVWIDKANNAPEEEIIVYRIKYRAASYLVDVIQSVTSARSLLSRGISAQPFGSPAPNNANLPQRSNNNFSNAQQNVTDSGTSSFSRIDRSENDQIAFSVLRSEVPKVTKLLQELDTPSGEVLLKAAVYEVGSEAKEGHALKLIGSLLSGKLKSDIGQTITGASTLSVRLSGLEVVLSALDQDSRFKSLSRPQVRVKSGEQARFTVGQDVPVLGATQLDRDGNRFQSVDYKSSGVIFTAKPLIREGLIEVDMSQELSNFILTTTGVNNSPTLQKRSVSTKLNLQPGEVVILGGLQSEEEGGDSSRVPFFGWVLGQSKNRKMTEIIVMIEAIRI